MSERLTFAATVTAEGRNIRGSVQLAGQRTERNGEFVRVDPAALMKASTRGLFASMEHDDSKLLGSDANNTLRINRTEQGFDYLISNVPNTTAGNDALELINSGEVRGSSFEITGMHSTFETDPETGVRTRVFDRIKNLISVSPVRDPAFPSMAAAFSKEKDVTAETEAEEQNAPAAPVQFNEPKSGKQQWARVAQDATIEQITATMDNLFSQTKGDLKGDQLDQYEAFNDELHSRKRADVESRQRAEQIKARHDFAMGRIPKAPEAGLYGSDDYAAAFDRYLRTGDKDNMAQFAQSIAGDGTQGGYAVPDGFLNRVVVRMKAFGGVQKVADSITTADGQSLRWPSVDDTANSAVIVAEGVAAGSGGADITFGDVTLGAYTFDATGTGNLPLLVSKELLQDSAIDMEGFIGDRLAERIGRKMASEFANGTGSNEPKGLFAKSGDAMTATTFFAAVQEHYFQVDQAYREGGDIGWIMSDTNLAKVLGSVDKNGRPLFQPTNDSTAANGPAGRMLGYPVYLDQAAGTKVAFGDFKRGFIIRYVRGVQIDVDPYTAIKTRQVAYHAWARADSNVQDANAYSVSDYTSVTADAAS